ncbi:hypothetical protein [Segatella copri]|jgi:hypothetical protein|uniref:hypothetical protein n=1 Tax=Segatella copri TaxID=165179 RepID=UPI0022E1384D|nr:hypothetical protein [Segatella copri]
MIAHILSVTDKQKLSYLLFCLQNYILFMTPARFMEEISRWIDENYDNKVDEKCDDSGRGTKKGRFQIALESASIIYGR